MKRLASVVGIIAIASGSLIAISSSASATTFKVTVQDDPAPDGCTQQHCSLREAVLAANEADGPDVIKLPVGGFQLHNSSGDDDDAAAVDDLDITEGVTIDGAGMGRTVVKGTPGVRAFHVVSDVTGVTLTDLTVTDGDQLGMEGTAIRNEGGLGLERVEVTDNGDFAIANRGGDLTVDNSRITGNGAGLLSIDGGATVRDSLIASNTSSPLLQANFVSPSSGVMAILRSEIRNNGGGIASTGEDYFLSITDSSVINNYLDGCETSPTGRCAGAVHIALSDARIVRSHIDHNTSETGEAAGLTIRGRRAEVSIKRSTVDGNVSLHLDVPGGVESPGGGISVYERAKLKIDRSSVSFNRSRSYGAGIAAQASLQVTRSIFRGNRSRLFGGALYVEDQASITSSIFDGNQASHGGALALGEGSELTLLNSTLANNVATSAGGGLYFHPVDIPPATLRNVTISDNIAGSNGGGIAFPGPPPASVEVFSSIVAGNAGGNCNSGVATGGPNLDNDSSCFSATAALHANPKLGPLDDNGGPTPTRALLAGSPAIDAIKPDLCPPPATDQRGTARPQDGDGNGSERCDLGAYERK